MTSNPAAAVRMLVIYSICVPLAGLVGFLACNQMDFGTLGFFGLLAGLLLSPLIIRYHYHLLILGFGLPIYCFFLKGNPPFWQVTTLISLGLAVVDRTLNSEKRFMSVPLMTWPLLFVLAVTYATAELTGGIGLKTLGGAVGGGKKYLAVFIGVASYFALTSRPIPKDKRKFFIALYFLAGLPVFFGDIGPMLPAPLNYINLLIPPTEGAVAEGGFVGMRFAALSGTASVVASFLLVRHGLSGVLNMNRPLRLLTFLLMLGITMLGGFRSVLIAYLSICLMLFFLEGLYRTQLVLLLIFGLTVGGTLMVPFADKLPSSMQRTLSFLPFVHVDEQVLMDAEGSKKWREDMWRDLWPKVPQYLILGKGYSLSEADFEMMGNGTFSSGIAAAMDKSQIALAISGDYHNGPLSTLIPFGMWGAIAYLWVSLTALFVIYRNYRYTEPDLKTFNAFMLVYGIQRSIGFFTVFGAYSGDLGDWAKVAGLSIALNWGIRGPAKEPRVVQRINRMKTPQPA